MEKLEWLMVEMIISGNTVWPWLLKWKSTVMWKNKAIPRKLLIFSTYLNWQNFNFFETVSVNTQTNGTLFAFCSYLHNLNLKTVVEMLYFAASMTQQLVVISAIILHHVKEWRWFKAMRIFQHDNDIKHISKSTIERWMDTEKSSQSPESIWLKC